MFAEFVTTYVPFAIAAVIIVPVVLVHVAMFIEALRTKRRPRKPEADRLHLALESRPAVRRRERQSIAPTITGGGLGLRHGIAARRDHD